MKLTTKLMLIFLTVSLLGVLWLDFFAIPKLKNYLVEREVNYAKSYLEMAADETRTWLEALGAMRFTEVPGLAPGDDAKAQRDELFKRLNERFTRFYFHSTGRLFVINSAGEFVVHSDQIMRGHSISNRLLFGGTGANRLIQRIIENRGEFVQHYDNLLELDEVGKPVSKVLFVKYLLGTEYFVCISLNRSDIYYAGDLAAKSLALLLVLMLLFFFFLFHLFYVHLRRRYDMVVDNAHLIEKGNYELSINDSASDEIGVLARIIDKLAAGMRQKVALEDQLRQAQKMEMVGVLASGIAHDFNNILAGITSSVDLLKEELRSPTSGREPNQELLQSTLDIAANCANRGRDTVAQMLSFSRVSEKHMRLLDLNEIIMNMRQICMSSFDKRISITIEAYPKRAVVKADSSQLEQALLNVCINARDAMPEGGELCLSIALLDQAAPTFDRQFVVTVQDTGGGIPADLRERIFEPFFTTKKKGSGLGLAMVYKIIDEHGGHVEIESKEEVGTKFRLFLPMAGHDLPPQEPPPASEPEAEEAAQAAQDAESSRLANGDTTVLVVEDETYMRQLTEDILQRLGYLALTAKDGQEAVDLFREQHEKIDLVILDLLLPVLAGDAVYDQIRAINPKPKVLLVSGSKRDPRIGGLLAKGCDGFLQKPFAIEDLKAALADLTTKQGPRN